MRLLYQLDRCWRCWDLPGWALGLVGAALLCGLLQDLRVNLFKSFCGRR